jgi:hypothetical protein
MSKSDETFVTLKRIWQVSKFKKSESGKISCGVVYTKKLLGATRYRQQVTYETRKHKETQRSATTGIPVAILVQV